MRSSQMISIANMKLTIKEGQVMQMNTLEELIYYCREPDPVGALLLSGEWGCGKTYLIEHGLRKALENEAFVLRISLFGISSLEGVHTAVKQMWMDAYYQEKGIGGAAEKAQKAKEMVSKFDFLPDWVKGVASTNWTSFIEIKNNIEEKPVILIFDDLERSRMDSIDVLGAINDYCENMKFHTIIIANQNKMQMNQQETKINAILQVDNTSNNQSNNGVVKSAKLELTIPPKKEPGAISYSEIKEKIIQRTVKYIPDFDAIIHTVIEDMKYEVDGYKNFVKECEGGILELFAPDRGENSYNKEIHNQEDNKRPHNIRSLKCAISDFYRVYKILTENQIDKIDRWFYSFASYVIAYKADIAKEGAYGTLFADEEVKKLYPAFQNQYIFSSVKNWILHGIWDEEKVKFEIETLKEREKAETPGDVLRTHRIMEVDEEIVSKGFDNVLQRAYEGNLTLDEYVQFIINCCWARKYNFSLPTDVEWKKVQQGVECCIKKLVESLPEGQQLHSIIGIDNKENFTDDEWKTYETIYNFENGNTLMFSKNRKMYTEGMKRDGLSTFLEIQNKRFDVFDEEMANITAEAFEKANNGGKSHFSGYFKEMWQSNIMSQDINIKESIIGFEKLLTLLVKQNDELRKSNKSFAILHTDTFIKMVKELIEKTQKLQEIDP